VAEVDTEAASVAAAASMAAVAAASSSGAVQSPSPPPASGDREQQMAAIRQMLSDLKENADAAPEDEPEPMPEAVAPTPITRKRADDEEDERDTLKSRIDELDKAGRAAKGEAATTGYDPAKLRRMHEKRAKRLQRSRERKKRSGAFLTGFTLVGLVTATMVGLYMLRPQIIAAAPEMGPAMNQYVVTVDRYRVDLNEATAGWKAWLDERIGNLMGKKKDKEAEG